MFFWILWAQGEVNGNPWSIASKLEVQGATWTLTCIWSPRRMFLEPENWSWSVRSTGNNLHLWLASEGAGPEASCRTESLTCGLWCYLWIDSDRIEVIPCWCLKIACWWWGKLLLLCTLETGLTTQELLLATS